MSSKGVRKYRDSQSYESQAKREQIHKQASGYLKPAQRAGCHSCVHAKPETANSRIAQAGAIERGKLDPLLRRSLAQLRKWAEWYGKADHAARGQLPLPPAGDVELAEDISAALGHND